MMFLSDEEFVKFQMKEAEGFKKAIEQFKKDVEEINAVFPQAKLSSLGEMDNIDVFARLMDDEDKCFCAWEAYAIANSDALEQLDNERMLTLFKKYIKWGKSPRERILHPRPTK
jgi:hypothetical protein